MTVARAIGVRGDNAGTVLAASKTYKVNAPLKLSIRIKKLTSKGKDRSKYRSSLLDGLTSHKEITVIDGKSSNLQSDLDLEVQFTLTVSEKSTKESKAAEESNKSLAVFGSLLGGMSAGMKNTANPVSNMLGGLTGNNLKKDASALKVKIYTVEASVNAKSKLDDSMISVTSSTFEQLPNDAGRDQQSIAAKKAVRSALIKLGKSIGAKALKKDTGGSSSLLD